MPTITLALTNPKAARLNAAFQGMYPIPQIPDPDYPGDPEDAPLVNEFTDMAWAKIQLRKFLARTVHRWERREYERATPVTEDPDIAT